MATPSKQLQTALKFVQSLDSRDYDALASTMAPDFTHRFFPASLNGFGKPVRTKKEFIEHVQNLMDTVFDCFNYQPPLEVIEAKDLIILHLMTDGKIKSGQAYNNEYMFTFRFDENGKIASVKEFMDSQYVKAMLGDEEGN